LQDDASIHRPENHVIGWRPIVERWRLRAVERIFRDSERRQVQGLPIRLTDRGIWVPTPFPVLVALLRATKAQRLFEFRGAGRKTILDAGAGDGRVLAALAYFEPELDVVGIESDERLCRLAAANLEKLKRRALVDRPERLRLGRGDYRLAATYESSGIRLEDVAFVYNYPDGNQDELERFIIERCAPGAKLCLLTHDRELRLSKLELTSKEPIPTADSASGWHWSVYST
ncbi:MAG: hypothetical protein ACRD21_16410, partial [Vicinamibacteria bacterium]